ncbi:hypothetical protein N9933_02285 [bacterium]|nr:hypothetical protein [bacterium]
MLYQLSYRLSFEMNNTKFIFVKRCAKIEVIMLKSNKSFCFFYLILGTYLTLWIGPQTPLCAQITSPVHEDSDNALKKAEKYFEKGQYTLALSTYESLYESNFITEHMLLRMAFLYENQSRFPEAIFALRKTNETFGTNPVDAKITQLKEQLGRRSVFRAERPLVWHQRIEQWQWLLLGVMAICWGGAILFLFLGKGARGKTMGLALCCSALLLGGVWLQHHHFQPKRAVIIASTSFYEKPGYASGILSLPLSPGTTVTIRGHSDIWVNISLGRIRCWVPGFVVREL